MTLNYDFDIFDLSPRPGPMDLELHDFLSKAGLSKTDQDSAIALFRDQKTVDALCRAPEMLREYFLQSGFGLNTFDSGAPAGRYPAQDEEARLKIIDQLTQNAARFVLPPDSGKSSDFRLADFITQLGAARPDETLTAQLEQDAVGPSTLKSSLKGWKDSSQGIAALTRRVLGGMPLWRQIRGKEGSI